MNQGLKAAQGEYIGIVESDDWVELNMFEELYTLATRHEVQVVRSNFYQYTDKKGDFFMAHLPGHDYNKIFCPKKRVFVFYCQPTIWASIYKKSFLEEARIDFLESPGASFQDTSFNFKVWAMAERVWFTTNAYYHYRCDHIGSSVKSQGKVFCVVDEWNEIERYLDQYPEAKTDSYVLRNHVKFGNYRWNLERLCGNAYKEFRKVFGQEFKEALMNDGLYKESFTPWDWQYLMEIVYSSAWRYRLHCLWHKLSRLFIKSKIRNGKKKFSVLYGLVRYERDVPHSLCPLWEENEDEAELEQEQQ